MDHAYTPGLRATTAATVRRERRLPLRGVVLVGPGERVGPHDVVARSELPGEVQSVNLAARLGVEPERVPGALLKPLGAHVRAGETIAAVQGLFGLGRQTADSPCDGVLESVSGITGQLLLREPPIPVEVHAYVSGVVAEVIEDEGVVVEAHGALLQGIFGVGGETWGPITLAVESRGAELTPARIRPEHRGHVLVGGSYVSWEALERARQLGVAAVVVGGFDDVDLTRLLGRDLGVAITGSEDLGITLVLTEGFGRLPMGERAWDLLAARAGRLASVSGATQIRAGVVRPEVLVPEGEGHGVGDEAGPPRGLEVGALLRVIREPWFGRLGRAVELPAAPARLETEALVRVLVIEFLDDGGRAVVPRANVERVG